MTKTHNHFSTTAREEAKTLARAEAQVIDSERMIARQKVLLGEIRSSGLRTVEAESSLVRLEAASAEFRAQRDGLLAKARQRSADLAEAEHSDADAATER